MHVWVFVILVVVGDFCGCTDESDCIQMSKYDYDYKMLKQMVKLETDNEQLRDRLATAERLLDVMSSKVDEIDDLKRTLEMTAITARSASTYVRWGRPDCPTNNTELVYAGAASGSHYDHYGGAANFLCLSLNPSWLKYNDGLSSNRNAFIYGTEYRFHNRIREFFDPSLYGHDVPCAVCRSVNPAALMIPGQITCPAEWSVEYKGYLVTRYPDHKASGEYICLDEDPKAIERSSSSADDGARLYVVEAQCGSLHCPPYISGRELTCVVCSR